MARYWNSRKVLRLVALTALALPLAGVGAARAARSADSPKAGGTLTVAYSVDASTLDPAQAVNPPDNGIATGALYSGLYRINVQDTLVPDIAAGYPQVNANQTVFTIHLKHGVYFNALSGFTPREVTAQDVKYTLERVLSPKLKPSVSFYQGPDEVIAGADAYVSGKATAVSGIQVLDRYTVRITLARPEASFTYVLATTGNFLVPKEAVDKYGADFGSHPVGTGPFLLKRWVKTQQLELVRNPKYFVKGLPYLDGITFQFNVGKDLEILRWQSGQVDAIGDAYDLPPNRAADLSTGSSAAYVQPYQPSGTTNVLYLNNLIPPFNNKLVREAVAYAVDKHAITLRYHGQALLSSQIYPPAVTQHQAGFTDYPYDPAMARKLLKQSGYGGKPVEVLVDVGSSNDPIEAPVFEQNLRDVGFTVKERAVSDQQDGTIIFTNKGYTILFGYWGMDYPDAFDFVDPTYTSDGFDGGLNFSRYRNPLVDQLTAQAESLPFGKQRDAVYARIQRTLVDDVAAVPLFYRLRFNLGGSHVGSLGWTPAYSPNEWAYAWRR